MRATIWAVLFLLAASAASIRDEPTDRAGGILFREGFDDERLIERGWDRSRVVRRQAGDRSHGRDFAIDRFPEDAVQPVPDLALLRPRPVATRTDVVD